MLDLDHIDDAVRHENGVSRRLFLGYAAALAAIPLLGEAARGQATTRPTFASDPFTLGVASGSPAADGFVLWTKLAPKPLEYDGGMSPEPVEVTWEIADDEAMTKIVKRGTAVATPALNHTVHVEVADLSPDRWYWYRFRAGDAQTVPARTRTMPAADQSPGQLRLAVASCQHIDAGLWTAYDYMAKDELDLVCFLGDYIYEGGGKPDATMFGKTRGHIGPTTITLEQYRQRHAQYRLDPLIQRVHAQCPWLVTWDDHEVTNDYANEFNGKPDGGKPAVFLKRRAAAYRAYYEHMPLRATSLPRGATMDLYARVKFGSLADFYVLDTRQYRSRQPVGPNRWQNPLTDECADPGRTIMGPEQRDWLKRGLAESKATWNVLAQQVMMNMLTTRKANEDHPSLFNTEKWAGYLHDRTDLMQHLVDRKVSNPVVLTGDIHANFMADLRVDDRKQELPIVGTEFTGTSISSGGDGTDRPDDSDAMLADNPALHYYNRQRGYIRCTVDAKTWRADYVTLDQVQAPGGKAKERSFVVEAGQPGAKPA